MRESSGNFPISVSERRAVSKWRGLAPDVAAVAILLVLFAMLFGNLLQTHMLEEKPDGLYSGGATWADLPWHLAIIHRGVEVGLDAIRENPVFPGTTLAYPFLPDHLSAVLVRSGASLRSSLTVPAMLFLLASVAAIYSLARSMTGSTLAAFLSPLLVLFFGSVTGLYYLVRDYKAFLWQPEFLTSMPRDYSHLSQENINIGNFISEYLLPQRASDFGLFFGVISIHLLWLYWDTSRQKFLLLAGFVLSLMPLIHFHSFVALTLVAGFLSVIQFVAEPRKWKTTLESWLIFILPLLAIALPQASWILPAGGGGFLRTQYGWMKGEDWLFVFWLKNLSPHLFVFAFAYWFAKPKLKSFFIAFILLFVLGNVVIFQPWVFDNVKLFFWSILVGCILSGFLFAELYRRYRFRGLTLALFLFLAMTGTGVASVWRESHLSWRIFSTQQIELAKFIRERTSKDALFLTSDRHDNPVASLAGRRILMGYRGWLWSHGIDYRSRERDVFDMYRGGERAIVLMRKYGVDYVLIENDKIQEFHINPEFFLQRFPVAYADGTNTLLQIPE